MELSVLQEDLDPLPGAGMLRGHLRPMGLLNSNYQRIVQNNFNDTTSHSVFGIRQRLKRTQFKFTSGIEVLLKVSAFVAVMIVVFS